MRFWLATFSLCCCCAVNGYCNESVEAAPAEVTQTEEGSGEEVAIAPGVGSHNDERATKGGCGCGTNKPKF